MKYYSKRTADMLESRERRKLARLSDVHLLVNAGDGEPSTSTMRCSWSDVLVPGNTGALRGNEEKRGDRGGVMYRLMSSARMVPTDHYR